MEKSSISSFNPVIFFLPFNFFCFQIYLEYRMRSQNTRILRHLFQIGVMAYGVWVACTRVFDYKHRLSDVAGGLILGAIVGVFAVSRLISTTLNECDGQFLLPILFCWKTHLNYCLWYILFNSFSRFFVVRINFVAIRVAWFKSRI